jgi:hypothetical protein
MQTFLPYESFTRSARALDYQRLGKQRVECLQVLNVFAGVRAGWGNHPITRMWTGHELSLVKYSLTVCHVWHVEQGYRDTCYGKIRNLFPESSMAQINNAEPPPWLGDEAFHRSHQSNLVRKAQQYYFHHSDRPHEPHGQGRRHCDGNTPHKPHRNCEPKLMWRHYRPQFPDVPINLPYVWPV